MSGLDLSTGRSPTIEKQMLSGSAWQQVAGRASRGGRGRPTERDLWARLGRAACSMCRTTRMNSATMRKLDRSLEGAHAAGCACCSQRTESGGQSRFTVRANDAAGAVQGPLGMSAGWIEKRGAHLEDCSGPPFVCSTMIVRHSLDDLGCADRGRRTKCRRPFPDAVQVRAWTCASAADFVRPRRRERRCGQAL